MVRTSSDGVDGGAEAIAKQRGFTLVRPDEGWFPGLEKLREELAGHQWIFGKTPKFKVSIFTTTCCVQRLLRRLEYFLISSEMAFQPHMSALRTVKVEVQRNTGLCLSPHSGLWASPPFCNDAQRNQYEGPDWTI